MRKYKKVLRDIDCLGGLPASSFKFRAYTASRPAWNAFRFSATYFAGTRSTITPSHASAVSSGASPDRSINAESAPSRTTLAALTLPSAAAICSPST